MAMEDLGVPAPRATRDLGLPAPRAERDLGLPAPRAERDLGLPAPSAVRDLRPPWRALMDAAPNTKPLRGVVPPNGVRNAKLGVPEARAIGDGANP